MLDLRTACVNQGWTATVCTRDSLDSYGIVAKCLSISCAMCLYGMGYIDVPGVMEHGRPLIYQDELILGLSSS